MYLGHAVAHLHLSPDEFYKLSIREFWCAANSLHPTQEQDEVYETNQAFFEDDEIAIFKDIKIKTARKRKEAWQAAHSDQ